jgi:transcription-repair coupling factor (superfamily II helicase)
VWRHGPATVGHVAVRRSQAISRGLRETSIGATEAGRNSNRSIADCVARSSHSAVPGPIRWANSSLRLRKHDTFKEDVVRQFLEGAGYSLDERVEIPGSALFLGQMLEVSPAGAIGPVRLEYSNDKVLETTAYDPASQRRLAEIDELVLDVTSEWVERPTCDADGSKPMQPDVSTMDSVVLDYAPSARIIADFGVRTRARSWIQQIDEASFEESPRAARQKYLTMEEWEAYLRKRKAKLLPEYAPFEQVPRFAGSASPGGSFRKFVEGQQAHGRHVVLTAATERDLRTMDGGRVVRASAAIPGGMLPKPDAPIDGLFWSTLIGGLSMVAARWR